LSWPNWTPDKLPEDIVTEDTRSQLLETLAAQAGEGANVQDLLLAQLGDNADPTVNLIARYLAQQSQTDQVESNTSTDEEETEFFGSPSELNEARAEERARSLQRLRQTMEQMYREVEALRERNDTLAAALGACYLCWGEDLDCPVCSGTGHPGSLMPDKSLLLQLVAPAVQQLRKQEDQDQRTSGNTDPQA
jgi:DNA repair exonuclease SbcCD ATPase subunit